jgi:SAM-dependent methyltransferase
MKKFLKLVLSTILQGRADIRNRRALNSYYRKGGIPWSPGYSQYKELKIKEAIKNETLINGFGNVQLPLGFGKGIDERIVEYPWLLGKMGQKSETLLDAGSTFNFEYLLQHSVLKKKELCIYTFFPERPNFNFPGSKISYLYGDLRNMPFKDDLFDLIVCQSTLEHVDMDNSIYGYSIFNNSKNENASYEYLKAINELTRVLKPCGSLLLTFPFGSYENHGFFQQFDNDMLDLMLADLSKAGLVEELTFFKYSISGWKLANLIECTNSKSFNPQTGIGKGEDGAAHCRAICCIKFVKSNSLKLNKS